MRAGAGTGTEGAAATGDEDARLALPVVAVVVMLLLPMGMNIGPLAMSPMRALCIAMAPVLLLRLVQGHYGRILPPDWLVVLHVAWMGMSFLMTTPEYAVSQTGSVGLELIGGYMIARAYIRTPAQFQRFCRLLGWVVCLTIPAALWEAKTSQPIIGLTLQKLPGLTDLFTVKPDIRWGMDRVQATFAHPIHYGLFCSVCFSMVVVGLKGTIGPARRAALALAIGGAGILSLSSGGMLAIALQLGLIGWAAVTRAVPARWRILAGGFAVLYVLIDLASNRAPIHVFMSYATFSAHTAYWRLLIFEYGWDNVLANPIFGLGLADWARPAWMHTDSVDNYWLLQAMRHGLPGLATIAGAWLWTMVVVGRRPFAEGSRSWAMRRAFLFSAAGLAFTLATVHAWGVLTVFCALFLGSGAWMATATEEEEGSAAATATTDPRRAPGATRTHAPVGPRPARAPVPQRAAPVFARGTVPKADRAAMPTARFGARHMRRV